MSEKLSIEVNKELFERLKKHAELEGMDLSRFITEAAERYIDQNEYIDSDELAKILESEHLLD